MGHREVVLEESDVEYTGASTVRMGRCVVDEMGGPPVPESRRKADFSGASSD